MFWMEKKKKRKRKRKFKKGKEEREKRKREKNSSNEKTEKKYADLRPEKKKHGRGQMIAQDEVNNSS